MTVQSAEQYDKGYVGSPASKVAGQDLGAPSGRAKTKVASAATHTPAVGVTPSTLYAVTALAAAATFNAPTGTPDDGNVLRIRLKDNGTARALTWNAAYKSCGATLPTTTVVNKVTYVEAIYNADQARWDVVDVRTEA